MTKDERIAKSEAARNRRKEIQKILLNKTERYLKKMKKLKKKKMKMKRNKSWVGHTKIDQEKVVVRLALLNVELEDLIRKNNIFAGKLAPFSWVVHVKQL